jgi:hypothetical protein
MSLKYIHHHLGLGDHIICNGMVRHFCKKYDNVVIFSYTRYYENVNYMYRDLDNLEIFDFDREEDAIMFVESNTTVKNNLIKPGFEKLDSCLDRMTFDEAFYHLAGLDFQIRFDEFYIERDIDRENEVCKTLNPDGEKYIFVHDDASRGFSIDMNKVTKDHKIIMNDKRFNVFDYITLIENAEEIHFMQSSFKELMCSYELKKPILYQHNYVRQYDESMNSSGLNPFIEIY